MLAAISTILLLGSAPPQLPAPNVDYFRDASRAFAVLPPQDLGVNSVAELVDASENFALISRFDEASVSPYYNFEPGPQSQYLLNHRSHEATRIPRSVNRNPYTSLSEFNGMVVVATASPQRDYYLLAPGDGTVFRRLGILSSPPRATSDGRLVMVKEGLLWFISPIAADQTFPVPVGAYRLTYSETDSLIVTSDDHRTKWEFDPDRETFRDVTSEIAPLSTERLRELAASLYKNGLRVAEKPIFGDHPRSEWWVLPPNEIPLDTIRTLVPHERPIGTILAPDADGAILVSPELVLILRDQRIVSRRIVPVPLNFYEGFVRDRIQNDALWRAGIAATEMRKFRTENQHWPSGTEWSEQIAKRIVGYPMSDLVMVPLELRTNELAYINTAYGVASIDMGGVASWQEAAVRP